MVVVAVAGEDVVAVAEEVVVVARLAFDVVVTRAVVVVVGASVVVVGAIVVVGFRSTVLARTRVPGSGSEVTAGIETMPPTNVTAITPATARCLMWLPRAAPLESPCRPPSCAPT